MAGVIYLIVAVIFVARLMSAINKAKDNKTYGSYKDMSSSSTYHSTNQRYVSNEDINGAPVGSPSTIVVSSASSARNTMNHSQASTPKAAPNTYTSKKNSSLNGEANAKTNLKSNANTNSNNAKMQSSEKKKSTTEILNEKAMEDQKQHRIEKMTHAQEERRIHGNLRYAGRHYPGDSIPHGMREVICDYCNAENLVPAHDFTTKYNCYFCREVL